MSKLKREIMPDGREIIFCGMNPFRRMKQDFLVYYTSGRYELQKYNNQYLLVSKGVME